MSAAQPALAMVRIVREAVANAARHGGARHVDLGLDGPEPLVLRIGDDGHGFDLEDLNGAGFGLTSMGERAAQLGGTLHIDSAPGAGTRIEIVLPS